MSATVNHAEDECLSNMLSQLDSSFGNRKGLRKLVDGAVSSLSDLKNGLAREMAEEVADLVLKGGSEEAIKQLLKRNFPSGVTIGNVEEMLKLVYVGADKKNLKKAINFVQIFDLCHQAGAYKALYEDVKFKKHTNEPEMLLLQKKIRLLKPGSAVLTETKKQVDEDCKKIISRIVKGIKKKDYSISIYVAKELDYALLNENLATIVQEFSTGSLENTLLLIQYSVQLRYIENQCFLMDALLKELEKRQLLDSIQGMHLWAHATFTKEEQTNWPNIAASTKKLCTDALEKLAVNKEHYFRHYQKYVEDPDKQKIRDLHRSNWHLYSIVGDFVSFYYNGEVGRTQNLHAAANAITQYDAVGRILSQLYAEIAKSDHLKSFEAFRLFNRVKCQMSLSNYDSSGPDEKPFEKLKEKAPACVRQLLWSEEEGSTEFQVVNKFFNATLSVQEDNNSVVCFDSTDKRSNNQTWKITIDEETSLLTLTHEQKKLQLGQGNNSSPCLAQTGVGWMVKAMDELHFKIYCGAQGAETFLTGDEQCGEGCHSIRLRKENNTDMQLWKLNIKK